MYPWNPEANFFFIENPLTNWEEGGVEYFTPPHRYQMTVPFSNNLNRLTIIKHDNTQVLSDIRNFLTYPNCDFIAFHHQYQS